MNLSALVLFCWQIQRSISVENFNATIVTIHTSLSYSSKITQQYDVLRDETRLIRNNDDDHSNIAQLGILIVTETEMQRLEETNEITIISQKPAINSPSINNSSNIEEPFKISSYPCYQNVLDTVEEMAQTYPTFLTVDSIGPSYIKSKQSHMGYDIPVMIISSPHFNLAKKAPMVITAGQHSRELAPPEVLLRFAEFLLQNYGEDAEVTMILDRTVFYLVPLVNPDGRDWLEQSNHMEYFLKKNKHRFGCKNDIIDGVDLSHNYPMFWGDDYEIDIGSSACHADFNGGAPLSEPESKNLFEFCTEVFGGMGEEENENFKGFAEEALDRIHEPCRDDIEKTGLFIDLHSYGGNVYYPFGFDVTAHAPNTEPILSMASKLSSFEQGQIWGPGQENFILTSSSGGEITDSLYGMYCVPSYGIEIGTQFYETCEDFEEKVLPKLIPTLIYAAKTAKNGYTTPLGPDVVDATAIESWSTSSALYLEAIVGNLDHHNVRNVPIAKITVYVNIHPDDAEDEDDEGLIMNFDSLLMARTERSRRLHLNTDSLVATYELDVKEWEDDDEYLLYFVAEDIDGYRGTVMPVFAYKPTVSVESI